MSPEAFTRLCGIPHEHYGLESSWCISFDESVAIFLIFCSQNDTYCDIAQRFGHSQETIWQKFHDGLKAMDGMVVDYVRPQTTRELIAISNHFQRDEKYETYFHGFVGALDGTQVPVMVPSGREGLWFTNRNWSSTLMFWSYVIINAFNILFC